MNFVCYFIFIFYKTTFFFRRHLVNIDDGLVGVILIYGKFVVLQYIEDMRSFSVNIRYMMHDKKG